MKFYYENKLNFKNTPNGVNNNCKKSELDSYYGFKNPVFEFYDNVDTVWNFTPNNREVDVHFLNHNINYFNDVFAKVSNKRNIKLVFSSIMEGANMYDFFVKLVELKKNYGLDKRQVVVITFNEISKNFQDEITVICKPFLLWDLSLNYSSLLKKKVEHNGEKVDLCTTKDYLNTPKEKFFLSYNKNCTRPHRKLFIMWLLKSKLIDDTLYSLLISNDYKYTGIGIFREISERSYTSDLLKYHDDFLSLGYEKLDWDYKENKNDVYSNTTYTTKDHYSKTLFNVVTETSFENNSLNLTEKTFKPLANCQPFIILGDLNANKKILDFGFEPYDDLIDYSFDSIEDNVDRFVACTNEIERIHSLGEEYVMEWYRENINKIENNKKLFLEYSKINLIEETIKDLKMKKILITGSSGLVGTHLVKKCLDKGYEVIGVDVREPLIDFDKSFFTHHIVDLTNEVELKNIFKFERPDAVLNCFGIKGSPLRAKNYPVDFLYPSFKINTEIINQCSINKIWLVFVSSVGVYSPAEEFVEEDVWKTLPSESDWYPSWSKRMGELLLEAYKKQYTYNDWSIIRPANIFGEYDDFSGNGTVISTLITKVSSARNGGNIEAWGDGSPIRDFVYAGDVADAVLKLYEDKLNVTVNFGSGVEKTIKDLVDDIIELSGKNIGVIWDTSKPNGDLKRLMETSIQRKHHLLPKLSFKEGLKLTYDYYEKNLKKSII
jgi:GDP-L-fucose synthase